MDTDTPEEPPAAPLMDLTNTSLPELLEGSNEALNQSLRRLLADIKDPDGVISAFANVP